MTPIDNKTTVSSFDPLPKSAGYHGYALGDFERSKTGRSHAPGLIWP